MFTLSWKQQFTRRSNIHAHTRTGSDVRSCDNTNTIKENQTHTHIGGIPAEAGPIVGWGH